MYGFLRLLSIILKQKGGPVITFHAPDILLVGGYNAVSDFLITFLRAPLRFFQEPALAFSVAFTHVGRRYAFMLPWYFLGWLFYDVYDEE